MPFAVTTRIPSESIVVDVVQPAADKWLVIAVSMVVTMTMLVVWLLIVVSDSLGFYQIEIRVRLLR